jgi:methionyl-tRNA formyltransferase
MIDRANLKKIRIIFMGTSNFAVPALQFLIDDNDFEIIAIYSKEPKIAGRGHKITNSPVHNLALKNDFKIITPKTLKNQIIQQEFFDLKADVVVVVDYGLLLPWAILQAPKFGCVNIHPSLLPKWRGAAPIQRAIMAGDIKTGVDVILMDEGLDSGDILAEETLVLNEVMNYQELAEKLSIIGAELLIKTIKDLVQNKCQTIQQNHNNAIYAHKIDKQEFLINWNCSAKEVSNQIRGLSGFGSAYFEVNGEKIKIHQAKIIDSNYHNYQAGKIIDDQLTIACKIGLIRPLILQKAGKNKMKLEDFLRGFGMNSLSF